MTPADLQNAPKDQVIVELLSVCVACSNVSRVVDRDTIRSVIGSSIHEIFVDDALDLCPLWVILLAEPGITPDDAATPLLVFQTFDTQLGIRTKLPAELEGVPASQRLMSREMIGITDNDLDLACARALERAAQARAATNQRRDQHRPPAPAQSTAKPAEKSARKAPASPEEAARRKKIAAGVLGALALAGVAYQAVGAMGSVSRAQSFVECRDIVEVVDGTRTGSVVTGRVTDSRWPHFTHAQREHVGAQLAERFFPLGVDEISLSGPDGLLLLNVRSESGHPSIRAY